VSKLRQAGIGVVTAYSPKSLKAQLRQADAFGCHFAVIIGDEELAQGIVTLRDMRTAQQEPVTQGMLAKRLKETH
jgi:histidyl-tRNA synthetase